MVVAAKKSSYKENSEKRMEENRKRIEQLNKLSQALHTPNISPLKKMKPRIPKLPLDPSSIRRSHRVADKPLGIYKERLFKTNLTQKMWQKSCSAGSQRRDVPSKVYASDEDRAYAIQRAEDLQSSLDQNIPSFVKPMLHSYVTCGHLYFPNQLKMHLPSRDEFIRLIDEKEEETLTKYGVLRSCLTAGWSGFALDHELVDGDPLVFQVVQPTTYKIYIIRAKREC